MTHQLLKECHPSVSDSLNNSLKDVNARSVSTPESTDDDNGMCVVKCVFVCSMLYL